jgi:hypothetical protein
MSVHVANYMISFIWQSCCGERAGSHINLTKTKSRIGLRVEGVHEGKTPSKNPVRDFFYRDLKKASVCSLQ